MLGWIKGVFSAGKKLKEIKEAIDATKVFFEMFRELEAKYRGLNIPDDISLMVTQGRKVADEWEDVF